MAGTGMPALGMSAPGKNLIALLAAMLLLAGCSVLMDTGTFRRSTESPLTQSSYAAADMLIQQSRHTVSPDTPLEIGVLTDLDSPNERTNFGRMVGEQIASRFVQLGYNVTAAPGTGAPPVNMAGTTETPVSPGWQQGGAAAGRAIITGRYAVAREAVLVNLRVVEADTGRVIAAYDYNVPKTSDVRELTKTEADKTSLFNF